MIEITVNGNLEELDQSMSINTFLETKGFGGRLVAVAINSVVVSRTKFDATVINEGDIVEIVRPVGGGD